MPILNKNHTYGLVSKLFHWLMAIILIVTFVLGLNLEHNFPILLRSVNAS
jgi:cytochrome b561